MHGRVEPCVLVVLDVALGAVLEQHLNKRAVFGFDRKLQSINRQVGTYVEGGLSVDVLAVDVDFFVADEGDGVVHVAVVDRVEENVPAHLLYFSDH